METKKEQLVDPKVGQVAEGKTLPFVDESYIQTSELKTFEFESKTQGKAVELKALKYYLMSYRMVGIYQEAVTKRIFEDLKTVLGHNQITITSLYNTRGGMDVTCVESGVKGVITGY